MTRRPPSHAPRRRCRAFTMLELIIATSMMAVLALTLYASLRVAYRARDTANATVGPARSAELAVGLVRRDLENALPPTGILAGPFIGQVGMEVANASEVEFYTVAQPTSVQLAGSAGGYGSSASSSSSFGGRSGQSGQLGGSSSRSGSGGPGIGGSVDDPTAFGGVRRVTFLVLPADDGTGGSVLVRRVQRNLLATTDPEPEDEVVCRIVTEFTIRYFDGSQWGEDWDSTEFNNALPMAAEVSLAVNPPADSAAGRAAAAAAASGATPVAYRASRIFFLACRDDAALTQGATQ